MKILLLFITIIVIVALLANSMYPHVIYATNIVSVQSTPLSLGVNAYSITNMTVNNETIPIRYNNTQGNVLEGIGIQGKTLDITVTGVAKKTGQLVVEIPRKIIDSKYDDTTDSPFRVEIGLPDGAIIATNHFREIQKNSDYRTLSIDIPPRGFTYEIYIGGTQAIYQPNNLISIEPPLKQLRSGKSAAYVVCNEDMQYLLKFTDRTPACVKPDSMIKLLQRGWAKNPLPDFYDPYTITESKNTLLYQVMNLKGVRDWSPTGWKLMSATGEFDNNGTARSEITLYLPAGSGEPKSKCNQGWYAWIKIDLNTLRILDSDYPTNDSQMCGQRNPHWN